MKTDISKLKEKCRENYPEMKEFLSRLVEIPSVMSEPEDDMPYGKNSAEVLDVFLKKAESLGFQTQNFDNYAGTVTLGSGEPELGILCHLDVVDSGNGWSYPPFELTEADGKLYGRGTTDDKGPAVSVLYALKAVSETVPLKKAVRLIVGCNEENGSDDLEYYRKKQPLPQKLFTPDGQYPIINIEKGMIRGELSAGFSTDCKRYIAEIHGGNTINAVPDSAWAVVCGITADEIDAGPDFEIISQENGVKIISHGVPAHASTPEGGRNALTALIKLLSTLNLDDCDGFKAVKSMAELFPSGETDGTSMGLKCSDEKSGALTLVFSVLEFTENGFTGVFDIRFPVSKTVEKINSTAEKTLSGCGFNYRCIMGSQAHYVDENSQLVRTLLDVYESVSGEKGYCIAIGGGTYVHNTQGGVAFGAELPGKEYNMHCADEFTVPEEMIMNSVMAAAAIAEICG